MACKTDKYIWAKRLWKTHLINILSKKLKLLSVEANKFDDKINNLLEKYDCVVIENYEGNINENLFYSFINQIIQHNKVYFKFNN